MNFPLDPALFSGQSGSRVLAAATNGKRRAGDSDADRSEDSDVGNIDSEAESLPGEQDEDDDEDEEESDEDEPQQQPVRRKDKGKAREVEPESLYDQNVELNRLISAMRQPARGSTQDASVRGARFGTEWDQSMEEVFAELEEGLETGKNGRKKNRSRAEAVPSAEVRQLIGQANDMYLDQDYEGAIDILQEIIRIEPNIRSPWNTLAAIYDELGNEESALRVQVVAAHLTPNEGDTWRDLAIRSKALGQNSQAVYCYTQALNVNRKDVDALWDRSALLREMGDPKKAAQGFSALLAMHPHDATTLRALLPLLLQNDDPDRARVLLAEAFAFQQSKFPKGPFAGSLQTNDLIVLADICKSRDKWGEIIPIVKRGQRWLQGRSEQGSAWEHFPDDREYDIKRGTRTSVQSSSTSAEQREQEERLKFLDGLPVYAMVPDLRATLTVARLNLGYKDEAKRHLDAIKELDVYDHPSIYGELADAHFEAGDFTNALQLYNDMAECDVTNTPFVITRIGQCSKNKGDNEGAKNCFRAVLEEEPDNLDVKLHLAQALEELGEKEEALQLVNEVIQARRAAAGQPTGLAAPDSQAADGLLGASEAFAPPPKPKKKKATGPRGAARFRGPYKRKDGQERVYEPPPPGSIVFPALPVPGTAAYKPDASGSTDLVPPASPSFGPQDYHDGPSSRAPRMYRYDKLAREAEKETEFEELYLLLEMLEPKMLVGDPEAVSEWLDTASTLVDGFRETGELFPSDGKTKYKGIVSRAARKKRTAEEDLEKQASEMAARIETAMDLDGLADNDNSEPIGYVGEFRGKTFDEWLELAIEYGHVLSANGEFDEAEEMLKHLNQAAEFRSRPDRLQSLRLGLASCAIIADRHEVASDEIRKIMLRNQLQSDPMRLLLFCLGHNASAVTGYVSTNLQKFTLRQIKGIDQAFVKHERNDAELPQRDGATPDEADAVAQDEEEAASSGWKPTSINSHYLFAYACALMLTKSYQSAIYYFLRAYDVNPDDPCLCLGLAIAYLHRAMQRQSDNRQQQISQALAFLDRYRKLRGPSIEVEYNFGRCFEYLSIFGLAAKHYQRAMSILTDDEASRALQRIAAYNLVRIFMMDGNPGLARKIAANWLSL